MTDYTKYVKGGAVGLGVAAAALYMSSGSAAPGHRSNHLAHQSVEVPGEKYARMSRFVKDGRLMERISDDVTTLHEAFLRGLKISNNGPCLGFRNQHKPGKPYEWLSYQQVLDTAILIGAGFAEKGVLRASNARVGIYSQNRVEYAIVQQACYLYSVCAVPLYDTLGPDVCTYIINQAELELVVCDKASNVRTLLSMHKQTPLLRVIVIMDTPADDLIAQAEQAGIDLITFRDLQRLGEMNPSQTHPSKPEDIAIICYTSGTTGVPKGAMISHAGLIASCSAIYVNLNYLNFGPSDTMISFLPLAHMYEQMLEVFIFMNGAKIGFFRGDVTLLLDDIQILKPTIFPAVPRLLNRIYDKIIGSANESSMKRWLLSRAVSSKLKDVKRGVIRKDTIWDRLIFKKVQDMVGGQCKVIVTGSAPIAEDVLNFLRCAFACAIIEGYGQTETSGVATIILQGEGESGHVGPPIPCCMIKLVDVPEMNYFAANQQGEICSKGPNIFKGYLKLPDKTAETIDSDGWLHSGDIGTWLPNGSLKIIDRKKHIFKLAQGEYIAPEKIENIYIRNPAIAQMFVYGDSLQAFLVGVVVPDPETFQQWVKSNVGIKGDIPKLAASKRVKKALLASLTALGRDSGLQSFEQVKAIHIHPELFSIENGLLTPTFKSKRSELKDFFSKQIQEMYATTTTTNSKL